MHPSISILPVDERMEYVSIYMGKKGGKLCSSYADIDNSGYVICGIPFTKDKFFLNTSLKPSIRLDSFLGMLNSSHIIIGGNLPKEVMHYCTVHGIKYYDVLGSEDLSRKNARLTAEGLLISLLEKTSFSISDFRTLITGYGKCGSEIADVLNIFTDEIYIYDTNPSTLKSAKTKHYQIITPKELYDKHHPVHQINTLINTVPSNPFNDNIWRSFPENCTIFNIASTALHPPAHFSESVISCPGIPGKYAPKTAGTLIAKEICRHFNL